MSFMALFGLELWGLVKIVITIDKSKSPFPLFLVLTSVSISCCLENQSVNLNDSKIFPSDGVRWGKEEGSLTY